MPADATRPPTSSSPGSGARPDASVWGVVYAAGSGSRFGGRKQFERIGDERLVDRCVRVLRAVCDGIVVVLPPGVTWDGPPVERAVVGGATNPESVRAGVDAVPASAALVVLHSPSHPLVTTALVHQVVAKVRDEGFDGAAPAHPIHDVLKHVAGDVVVDTVAKVGVQVSQMPMAFRAEALRTALAHDLEGSDAQSIVERRGGRVGVVAGDPLNIHVTTPRELAMARLLAPLADDTDRR